MAPEIERRGMMRPISDLPLLVGSAEWLEVQQSGQFWRATPSQVAAPTNTVDLFTAYTAFQFPFSADFLDVTGQMPAPTATAVAIAAAKAVFAGTVGGGLSYVTTGLPNINTLSLGTECFTMEGWLTTVQTATTDIISKTNSSLNTGCWIININQTVGSGKIDTFFGDVSSSVPIVTGQTKVNDGLRHHFRLVRSGSRWSQYIDGVLDSRGTSAAEVGDNVAPPPIIFGNSVFARPFAGEMDNWRFLPGIALNTRNFTVPTPPFPTS